MKISSTKHKANTSRAILWIAAGLFSAGLATQATAQSRAGSRAASDLLAGGSELIAAGSVELLQGGAELVVTSAVATGNKVQLVVAPVAGGVSQAADFSRTLTIEISLQGWEMLRSSAVNGSVIASELSAVIGSAVESVALTTSAGAVDASTVAASAAVLGYVLSVEGVVIGVVPLPALERLLGHREHSLDVGAAN